VSITREIFVTFEMKPPKQLDIVIEHPSLWLALGKSVKIHFTSERKEARVLWCLVK
jgi:hypothetical protein